MSTPIAPAVDPLVDRRVRARVARAWAGDVGCSFRHPPIVMVFVGVLAVCLAAALFRLPPSLPAVKTAIPDASRGSVQL